MNWYLYIPSIVSIYLVFISTFFSGMLTSSVDNFVRGKKPLDDNKGFIKNVALDWVARINFVNSMIASMVSVFTIFANLRNSQTAYDLATVTFIFLLLMFISMFGWIMGHNPGNLVSTRFGLLKVTHATMCSIILLVVNLVLIGAVYISQKLS